MRPSGYHQRRILDMPINQHEPPARQEETRKENGAGLTMSKKGKCFFSLQMSESSFHCSSVGSTPVGFYLVSMSRYTIEGIPTCAHACSKIADPSGAAYCHQHQGHMTSGQLMNRTHLDIPLHTLKVESDGLFVKVRVMLDLESRVLGDRDMVTPSRSREVYSLGTGEPSCQECSSDTKGTGSRDGLRDGESVLDNWLGVFTVG